MNTQINGHLPGGWEKKPIGELFKVVGGGTPSTNVPSFWHGDVPWISSADIDEHHAVSLRRAITKDAILNSATNLVPKDSVIVVTRVGLGKVAITPSDLCFSQDNQALLFDPKRINPRFVVHQMGQLVSIFKHISRGTTISGVTKKQLTELDFLLPPKQDQDRIVEDIEKQFTRLDSGVGALRRVQAKLKKYRAAVLKTACEGRLVPTEAELAKKEGRSYKTGPQLLARILAERRKKWQGRGQYKEPATPNISTLSPLPEGWAWAMIEQLSTRVQYGSSAKTNEMPSGVPVLRMGNIQDGKIDFNKLKYLPKAHEEFPELLLSNGELLFNRTNSAELVGKTAVFKGTPNPCSFASYLIRVQFGNGCVPDFFSYFINSVFGRAWIAGVVSQQVGQANVNGTKLQALAVPLPPLAEQTRIVAEVERRLSVVEELESVINANLQRAQSLRQSILRQAFAGKLVPAKTSRFSETK